MKAARFLRVIAAPAAVAAVTLGLGTYTNPSLIVIHIGSGLLVTLALLMTSITAMFTSGLRRLGTLGVGYALILPAFGLIHPRILPGELHWLIEAAHLIVSFGAIPFIDNIGTRYLSLKQTATPVIGQP